MPKKISPTSSEVEPGVTLLDQTKSDPSYEGVYGARNPWVQWLAETASHALRFRPVVRSRPHGVRGARAPKCPACTRVMVLSMPLGVWVCHRENADNVRIRCNVHLPHIVTEGAIKVYDEDGKRIKAADLQNRPIDIVYERGKYRARAVIR